MNTRTKTLALETLEQRIALDASGIRPQLEAVREVYIDDSLVGPTPIVFGKSELIGQDTKSFVITSVAAGSTVEKLDVSTNQWRNVSAPITTSNPSELIRLMRLRVIQEGDRVRWIPKSTDGVTQKAFEIIGWDDGSEITEPEGVNVPGAVQNLEIDIVGDEVRVTWDPPTTGAAVTHYRIHQNPTTVAPSTQTSHTFAKVASPASYVVTVHANSAEGAGEAMTVTLSTALYVNNDGTVVDPILDTSGKVLDYNGPNIMPYADLTDADLTDADLTGVDLTRATLTGAHLTGAYLGGATLDGVKSGSITVTGTPPTLPTDWQLIDGYQIGGYLIGPGADLKHANLLAANLQGVNLSGADLTGATLAFVQSGGTITDVNTTLPTDWQLIDGYLIGPGANLTGADLDGANLNGADLSSATLFNVKLDGANLSNATLLDVDLSAVATLTNVKSGGITGPLYDIPADWQLINGYLIGPTADLSGADLSGMDLSGADLSGADLTNVKSGGTTGDGSTTLPTNWQLIDGHLMGPTADLSNEDLSGADLSGVDLSGADLSHVKAGDITGDGSTTLPTNWQLIDGYLIGPRANLEGEDLSGADLSGADLTGANLINANLDGTDLSGADLSHAWISHGSGVAKYNHETTFNHLMVQHRGHPGVVTFAFPTHPEEFFGTYPTHEWTNYFEPADDFDPVAAGWTLVS